MDDQLLQNLKNAIDKNEHVTLIVGKNPTLDQMAAALSFYLTLTQAGKSVTPLSVTPPTVEVGSLVGIDKVKTEFSSTDGDLIVSFPYEDGEIDKVSYTMDDNILNIVVTPGEKGINFNENDVKFARKGGAISLLFAIGTAYLDDIYSIISPESLTDATIINIDNKEENERYGEINLVSPRFSSLSEQVADLLLTLGYDNLIDTDTAQNLFSGVISGTNNFQNSNTSYLAFEISAILMKKGAVRSAPTGQNSLAANEFMSFMQPQQNQPQKQQGQSNQNQKQNQQNQQQRQNQPNRQQNQQRQQPQNKPQQQQPKAPIHDFPVDFPTEQVADVPTEQTVPMPQQVPQNNNQKATPPADWLTPKVYKGSTNV